ncbi:MAG: hypothetical protein KAI64_06175, partial [Thermoplasmata archaeon]|nr:hypothetical protein [Thermoplasmata archaeon]
LVYEPSSSGRVKIHDLYVYDALRVKPRLHPWLEYAEDIDYWYKEKKGNGDSGASCSFHYPGPDLMGVLRTPDIYVYTEEKSLDEWEPLLQWCVHHEVGHYVDNQLSISSSEEFQEAVKLAMLMLADLPDEEYRWRFSAQVISEFPGVFGNPPYDGGWGGYRELYAYLHDIDYLIEMPPPLRNYFDEFIPWDR